MQVVALYFSKFFLEFCDLTFVVGQGVLDVSERLGLGALLHLRCLVKLHVLVLAFLDLLMLMLMLMLPTRAAGIFASYIAAAPIRFELPFLTPSKRSIRRRTS